MSFFRKISQTTQPKKKKMNFSSSCIFTKSMELLTGNSTLIRRKTYACSLEKYIYIREKNKNKKKKDFQKTLKELGLLEATQIYSQSR